MPPLDPQFCTRLRRSSLLLGSLLVLLFAARPETAWSLAAGVAAAWLIWTSAEVIGSALGRRDWRARDVAGMVALYCGKYVLISLAVWWLERTGRLEPVVFTLGFLLPTALLLGKIAGRLALPDDLDPVPVYARSRKVADVE